jgi:extracellular factor (EF) 3-hydroxypalmitic acid methyl ester biosynthesis protein
VQLQRPFDPVVTFHNSQGESARGTLTSLQRRSLVMEIYNPYSIVQVSEVLNQLTIRSGERSIYKGKAVVVSLLNTGLMAVVSVALIDEWSDFNVFPGISPRVGEEAQRFVSGWAERFQISRDYQVCVSEVRAYLSEVSRWTDQADLSDALPRGEDGRVSTQAFTELAAPLMAAAAQYFADFEGAIDKVPIELAGTYRSFAQGSLHPLLLRAPFVFRTFAKPLGYAGDYEMVNQILSDPQQGPTTYFQMVNALFLRSAVAEAHRNRIDILVAWLKKAAGRAAELGRPVRILNIGCGPAVEIRRLLGSDVNLALLEFTLVDFSEHTLQDTRAKMEHEAAQAGETVKVNWVNESVHDLLKRASRRATTEGAGELFDFVYCAGLFDYLSDKVCARLLDYFKSRTRPNGEVLVTNVHPSNPQRGVMEHVLEWYLIYRDEAQLRAVLPRHTSNTRVFTDKTGVNVFAEFTVVVHEPVPVPTA